MSRRSNQRLVSAALTCAACVCVGCGSSEPVTGFPSAEGSSRLISLDGAEYVLNASPSMPTFGPGGGLQPLEDIDNDQYPDIVVALNRKRSGAPSEHTWIEAYSGRTGDRLWSLQGKYDRDANVSYQLGPVAALADINGDGVRDVYCREDYTDRSALLISGRTGEILGRFPVGRDACFAFPMSCRDANRDGVADFLFSSNRMPLTVVILSGRDLSEVARLENLWPEAGNARIDWVLAAYHDENRDGVPDCLVRRLIPHPTDGSQHSYEYAILDGATFALLRTFVSPRPRVTAKTFYIPMDDVNSDRVGDLVFSSAAGGGPKGRLSLLRAVSGADGAVVWDVSGSQAGEGAEIWTMDVRTGQKEALGLDVGFGNPLHVWPDRDGDGVDDIAALVDSAAADARIRPC